MIQTLSHRRRLLITVTVSAGMLFGFSAQAVAQAITATCDHLYGQVFVNGLAATPGMAAGVGDTLETGAESGVMLTLSDGSQLDIGENTQLNLAELFEHSGGARVSKIKLAWGWLRAKLSPGHQRDGSTFEIETPNALVGVKFSQPDIAVSYSPDLRETRALAHTVALAVNHLLTGETGLVPIGSTAIITDLGIQIFTGLLETGVGAAKTGAATKIALGAGAVLAVGGGIALAAGDSDTNGDAGPFTGTWVWSDVTDSETLRLRQHGASISGTYTFAYGQTSDDCREVKEGELTGRVLNGVAEILFGIANYTTCDGYDATYQPGSYTCELINDGGTYLYCDAWLRFERQ